MSEGYTLEGNNLEESADADTMEVYADDKLGFERLPDEIVIDSPQAAEAFKQEHGVDLSSYLEAN